MPRSLSVRARRAGRCTAALQLRNEAPVVTDDIGFIVLERGTSEERMDEMCRWLFEQPGVDRAYPYRHEGEEYAPDEFTSRLTGCLMLLPPQLTHTESAGPRR